MLALIVAACLFGADDPPAAEQDFIVEATSLIVQRVPKGVEPKEEFLCSLPGEAGSHACAGTVVGLHLTNATRSILGIDNESSEVLEFTDDKGNELAPATETGSVFQLRPGFTPPASPLRVGSFSLPGQGAKRIHLRGVVTLLCGRNTEVVRTKVFDIKKQEKLSFGTGVWEVTSVWDTTQDKISPKPGTRVRLKLDVESKSIHNIAFLTAEGETIAKEEPYRYTYVATTGIVDAKGDVVEENKEREVSHLCVVNLPPGTDRAMLEITRYVDFEIVEVPIDVSVGLGL